MFFLRMFYITLLISNFLFALQVDDKETFTNLLPQTEIYIDHTQKSTIETIKDKKFQPNTKKALGYGYSPDFHVWIRFTLNNSTSKPIHKILEYDNPLSSYVAFYTTEPNKLLKEDGLLSKTHPSSAVNPTLDITLDAYTSKTYYIEAYSHVTTLLVKLHLYTPKTFYKKEIKHQFILALFFGVMGIVILYNFIVFIMTQERSYLYYVLFFVGITVHHLIYRGVAHLYIVPQGIMTHLIEYSIFIVAFPAFFLALFMKEILTLKNYPKTNRLFNVYLVLFPFLVFLFSQLGYDNYRNLPTMILLCIILIVLIIMIFKKNRYAYYIATGWFLFISSAIAMQLSSMGKYDIFTKYPYYAEFALIIEAILFSLVLSNKIKQLHRENAQAKEKLLIQQAQEKQKLKKEVEEKTADLVKMVDEKQLLLKELNHRVKNNLQTILSFVRLHRNKVSNKETHITLETLEHRILSIDHLHTLLDPKKSIETINTKAYFSVLIKHLQNSFHMPNIKIDTETTVTLKFSDAMHCGIILNEAITNAYQHAFTSMQKGTIYVKLFQYKKEYILQIQDSGKGYNKENRTDSLGLHLMESLTSIYLEGIFQIEHNSSGTSIKIIWKEKEA